MQRVLIVDDDQLIRGLLVAIYEMQGIECIAVPGGEDAIRRLSQEHFDLVLLDLMMPDVDGFDVLDALPEPHPPVIVATAAIRSIIERLPVWKLAAVLQKPFDVGELIETSLRILSHPPQRREPGVSGEHAGASPVVEPGVTPPPSATSVPDRTGFREMRRSPHALPE